MVDHEDGFFLPPSGGNRISSSCINMMERGGGSWKPNTELSPACPRCGSSNTKFCYYNNYSLTQPRYFCKGCRRYWTKGGSLRNVPIGGGCRKSRRSHHTKRSPPPIRVPSTTDNIHGNFVAPSPFGLISTTHRYSNNSPSTPPGPSSSPDGPNIDLALVYANFLHPNKPQPPQETASCHHHHQQQQQHEIIPQLPNDNNTNILDHNPGPSFEFLGDLSAPQHQQDGSLSHDGNYVICHSGGLDPLHHHHFFTNVKNNNDPSSNINSNNYVLPPLPDDEELLVVSQEMVWPSISAADLMLPRHQILDIDYSSPPNSSLVVPQGQYCQRPQNVNDDMSSLINISNLDDIFKN
ncbi:hypothetical protein LIER_32320 [Lithospermum erythrorhizon]|uniref:Dof zinc finger protein n=1 Tax=Lithospermum erythrorhizon TaxID=34254 RepID=A0AAV3RUT5_LITER